MRDFFLSKHIVSNDSEMYFPKECYRHTPHTLTMDQSKDKQVNDNPWQRGY